MPWSKRHAPGKISGLFPPSSVRIPQLYLVYALGFTAVIVKNKFP